MTEVFVSLGSNVQRELNIPAALQQLEQAFGQLHLSSLYETEAVGFVGDPFFNLVAAFNTDEPITALVERFSEIEIKQGRTRQCKKFAPRTLDLDLLLYGDLVMEDGKLKLPRPELLEYAFMLEPMAELAPSHRHPVLDKRFDVLWDDFDKSRAKQRKVTPPWGAQS